MKNVDFFHSFTSKLFLDITTRYQTKVFIFKLFCNSFVIVDTEEVRNALEMYPGNTNLQSRMGEQLSRLEFMLFRWITRPSNRPRQPPRYSWLSSSPIWSYILSLSLMLRPTVSRPVCLGIKHPSGAYDQIFVTCVTVTVLFLWGALSDERSGLSGARHQDVLTDWPSVAI
jgi:hypothetical protein